MRKSGSGTRRAKAASGSGGTDWARVDATTDAEIDLDVSSDPDVAPIFTDEMFAQAEWNTPTKRTPITIKLEPDVLAFYRQAGRGYQTRMQAVLRAYMEQSKKRASRK